MVFVLLVYIGLTVIFWTVYLNIEYLNIVHTCILSDIVGMLLYKLCGAVSVSPRNIQPHHGAVYMYIPSCRPRG